jgi:hypothetical protein
MPNLKYHLIILLLFSGICSQVFAQELSPLLTLFTTPEERQLIDSNRYKTDRPKKTVEPVSAPVPASDAETVAKLPEVEVNVIYKISGVSINTEGSKTAWINGNIYESGDSMDDGSKIRIKGTSVIITTEDGKSHSGVSGEVLNLTYLKPVNQ